MLATSFAILSVLFKAVNTMSSFISSYEAHLIGEKVNTHEFLDAMHVSDLSMINEKCILSEEMHQNLNEDIKNSIHFKEFFPGYEHIDKVYTVITINKLTVFSNLPTEYVGRASKEQLFKHDFLKQINSEVLGVLRGTETILPVYDSKKNKIGSIFVIVNPEILSAFASPVIFSIVILILISLLVSYFLATVLSKSVVEPLAQLSEKLSALARNDNVSVLSSRIVLKKPLKEVEELAVSTNSIIEKVRENNEQIMDQKDLLENQNQELDSQNQELTESRDKLSELNATKDKFFSIISHDLKGPFSGMIGLSSLLTDMYDNLSDDEIKEYTRDINNSAKGMYKLLDNLLQWARMQTDGLKYQPEKVNLLQILADNFQALDVVSRSKNISLKHNIDGDVFLYVDAPMITTVLRNLLSNALKFTFSGGEINVSASVNGNFIEISVIDNGIGIEGVNLEKFFRIDSKVMSKGTVDETGTGLGLILCKEFVEKNGGTIWAESEMGKGTVFKFTVPVYKEIE